MKTPDPLTLDPLTSQAVRPPTEDVFSEDAFSRVRRGPLARPVMWLWRELGTLILDRPLSSVELDLTHLERPCFLLRAAPEAPEFYVELFVNEVNGPFSEELFKKEEDAKAVTPLQVRMGWTNSETEPPFWQMVSPPREAVPLEVDVLEFVTFVVSLIKAFPETDPCLVPLTPEGSQRRL